MNITDRVKAALRDNFAKVNKAQLGAKSYTRSPQENLLSGIDLAKVEDDLRRGDGDELRIKFCAIGIDYSGAETPTASHERPEGL
jgi:hypothetical protein